MSDSSIICVLYKPWNRNWGGLTSVILGFVLLMKIQNFPLLMKKEIVSTDLKEKHNEWLKGSLSTLFHNTLTQGKW